MTASRPPAAPSDGQGPETVLLVNNRYQRPGGEDVMYEAEAALLERHGHRVVRYEMHNDEVARMSTAALVGATFWNRRVYRELRRIVSAEGVQVAHFHNTFPLVSPAAYYAARAGGAAVVQTLHNFRLACPGATLFREGRLCEACVGRPVAWRGVVHGCYRGSRAATAATAAMLATHRALGTWRDAVDRYVALTDYSRGKFVRHGLPADRIVVKPNFLPADPAVGPHDGGFVLFVGRLDEIKGIGTLLDAWRAVGDRYPLRVVGDGPLADRVAAAGGRVEWLGHRPRAEVLALMQQATLLVFPSKWPEVCPVTVIEALGAGLPVLATASGTSDEMLDGGRAGWLTPPGDDRALAAGIVHALEHPDELARMSSRARRRYDDRYSAATSYDQLVGVYRGAMARTPGPAQPS
jgi:glycosyltransferase involved in cell wall biosynthesis